MIEKEINNYKMKDIKFSKAKKKESSIINKMIIYKTKTN